jgi:2-hydroxychromene-2-carboxylate isomerase
MSRTIDYYFSVMSTWAYIGHAAFEALVHRYQCNVRYRPMCLREVIIAAGGVPLVQRHQALQNYRLVELQRWAEKRSLSFNLHPRYFPADATVVDGVVLATLDAGLDPARFIRLALKGRWEQQLDLNDTATLVNLADEAGLPGAELVAAARSPAIVTAYRENTRSAIDAGVFGSPTYVLDGELFWGQDRLEFLAEAVESGRTQFRPSGENG